MSLARSAPFGVITGAADPRILQIGARITFIGVTLYFYLLVLLAPAALAAQGVVAGRVVDALTGAGVPNAEVYLGSSAQGLAQQSKTLSSPSGEFRFEAVLATEQYSFTVTKRTYLKASHPSRYQPAPFVIEPTGTYRSHNPANAPVRPLRSHRQRGWRAA